MGVFMKHITNCRSGSIILISLFLLSVTYVTSALAWESITDPAIPTDTTLRSLWGTSDADLFIIGDKGTILHFNGSTWTKATPTSQNLNDIGGNSAGTVFAVGNSYWDTSAWKATILKSTDAGANIFVAGSAVFGQQDYAKVIREMKTICRETRQTWK